MKRTALNRIALALLLSALILTILPIQLVSASAPQKFEYQETQYANTEIYAATWKAQTFTPQVTHYLTKVMLSIVKHEPYGDFIVGVRNTVDGKPTGNDLINKSVLATSLPNEFYSFVFDSQIRLEAYTEYAIVARLPNSSGDASHCMYWMYKNADVYSRGNRTDSSDSGATWSIVAYDFKFSEWGYPLPTVTISNPTNKTYQVSTIPVELSAVGNITNIWYNCKSGTSWVYGSNQTYTSQTSMTGFVDGTYTFYAWANDTYGNVDSETVVFTVALFVPPPGSKLEYQEEGAPFFHPYGDYYEGQTFTIEGTQISYAITGIVLKLYREGSPSGDFIVSIRATSGGIPVGDDLVTKIVTAMDIPAEGTTYSFVFDTEITVQGNTMYAIVTKCPDGDDSNFIVVFGMYEGPYPRGTEVYYVFGNWYSEEELDLYFSVWGYEITVSTKMINILAPFLPILALGAGIGFLGLFFSLASPDSEKNEQFLFLSLIVFISCGACLVLLVVLSSMGV